MHTRSHRVSASIGRRGLLFSVPAVFGFGAAQLPQAHAQDNVTVAPPSPSPSPSSSPPLFTPSDDFRKLYASVQQSSVPGPSITLPKEIAKDLEARARTTSLSECLARIRRNAAELKTEFPRSTDAQALWRAESLLMSRGGPMKFDLERVVASAKLDERTRRRAERLEKDCIEDLEVSLRPRRPHTCAVTVGCARR